MPDGWAARVGVGFTRTRRPQLELNSPNHFTTKDTKGARSYKWKLLVRPLCPSWLFFYWLGAPLRESGFANGLHRAIAPTNCERPNSPRTRVYFPRTALISSSLEGSKWAPPEDQP